MYCLLTMNRFLYDPQSLDYRYYQWKLQQEIRSHPPTPPAPSQAPFAPPLNPHLAPPGLPGHPPGPPFGAFPPQFQPPPHSSFQPVPFQRGAPLQPSIPPGGPPAFQRGSNPHTPASHSPSSSPSSSLSPSSPPPQPMINPERASRFSSAPPPPDNTSSSSSASSSSSSSSRPRVSRFSDGPPPPNNWNQHHPYILYFTMHY